MAQLARDAVAVLDGLGIDRAHARADQSGLARGAGLSTVTLPTLVTIPGMGHAVGAPVLGALGEAILAHTVRVDSARR